MNTDVKPLLDASASLQRIVRHPRIHEWIRYEREVEAFIIDERDFSATTEWQRYVEDTSQPMIDPTPVRIRPLFVVQLGEPEPPGSSLIVFTSDEMEAVPRFCIWNENNKTMRPIAPTKISQRLSFLKEIYRILEQKAFGKSAPPSEPLFI